MGGVARARPIQHRDTEGFIQDSMTQGVGITMPEVLLVNRPFPKEGKDRAPGITPKVTTRELRARSHVLAGSLLSLLRWWIDRGAKESPAEMDELFHQMVWKGMVGAGS